MVGSIDQYIIFGRVNELMNRILYQSGVSAKIAYIIYNEYFEPYINQKKLS